MRLAAATFVVDAAGFVAVVAVVEVGPELMRLFAVDRHDVVVVDTVAVAELAAAVVVAAASFAALVVAAAVAALTCAAQLYWAAAPDPTYNRFAVCAEWRVVVVRIVAAAAVAQDAAVAVAAVALPDAVAAPVDSELADVDDA